MRETIHVMIVEDDSLFALEMKQFLEQSDFYVTSIESVYLGVEKSISMKRPDIAVVNINLGQNGTGIEIGDFICKHCDIPIIYLVDAYDGVYLEEAIETNPICYLVKPINFNELRTNLLLGVYKTSKSRLMQSYVKVNQHYIYNHRLHELSYKGEVIPLTKTERIFIHHLIEANYEAVSTKEMEEKIWGTRPIKGSSLRTMVYRLRRKLPTDLIQTVSSIGFKIARM